MPIKELLEDYPLYKKMMLSSIPATIDDLPKPPILMHCNKCNTNTTFNMVNNYYDGYQYTNYQSAGVIIRSEYICMNCRVEKRDFFFKIDQQKQWIMKVGQYPAWEINGNKPIEQMLGQYKDYYKKGIICESQGYGIGSFGYYRRIVEEVIDELLQDISSLLSGDELAKYNEALEKTKNTTVTQEKIELVKDLLPSILRPDGMNPLQTLHSILSEGLHARSDDDCLQYSDQCRSIIIFLVNQISISKNAAKDFTTNMRKLLDKKAKS